MPLSTLTTETLLSRNDRAFERAKLQPNMAVDDLKAGQRRRLQTLLSQRSDIHELASTDEQRGLYGTEAWGKDFILLRDLQTLQNVRFEGEKLRRHVWSKVPNSRFKRFQELFSKENDFCVPQFTVDSAGTIDFGSTDFNTETLLGCLVSADRIPDQLAADLRLCDFSEDERDPLARLKKKREKIPELKKLWEGAVPLQEGHHRLLRIAVPANEIDAQYPSIANPDPAILGTILYTRERENGPELRKRGEPPAPRMLSVQHFSSVYAAHRKTEHEHQLYQQELETLTELQADLRTMNERLNLDWKKGTPDTQKSAMRADAMTLITRSNAALCACENKHKVHARDLLEGMETLKDGSGKENITIVMTKMVAAIRALRRRLNEVYPKGGFNHQDQMVLRTQIVAEEKLLKDFRSEFTHGAPHLADSLALFNPTTRMNDAALQANVRGVETRLGDPRTLQRVTLKPLQTYAVRLQEQWNVLHGTLETRNRDAAMDEAIKIHVIGKIQAACTCFERIKGFTGNALRIPLSQIRDFLQALRTILDERAVFPGRNVASYVAPFEQLLQTTESLQQELSKYVGQELEIGQRTALYQKLRESVDAIDLNEMIAKLP